MPQRKVLSLIVDLKDRASRGFGQLAARIRRGVGRTISILAQGAAAAAGYGAALGRLTQRGGRVLNVQRAFAKATGDVEGNLQKLRGATRGLVDNYTLMEQANTALAVGSAENIDQFSEMARVAQDLGRALGLDTAFALNSLNVGIARQSRLVLDNLGIIVSITEAEEEYAKRLGISRDELTKNQQQIAFRTAAMEAAREKVERLAAGETHAGDQINRFTAMMRNARDEVAKFLARSPELQTFFFEMANLAETIVLALESEDRAIIGEAFAGLGRFAGLQFLSAFRTMLQVGFRAISDTIFPKFAEEWAQFVPVAGAFKATADVLEDGAVAAQEAADAEIAALNALRRRLRAEQEARKRREGAGGGGTSAGAGGGGGAGGAGPRIPLMGEIGTGLSGPEAERFRQQQAAAEAAAQRRAELRELGAQLETVQGPGARLATIAQDAQGPWERLGGFVRRTAREIEQATSNTETMAEVTGGILLDAVQSFGSAYEEAIASAIQGSATFGEAFKGAMLGALASVARGFGQFYLAKATASLAQGIAGDPRGFGAAAKYGAAAALMFTVAGLASGLAGGGGGAAAGGGGAAGAGRDLEGRGRGEATIFIQGGLLDMSNPEQEESLRRALEDLSGRRVTVRRG